MFRRQGHRKIFLWLVGVASLSAALGARAQDITLHLGNGDRVTGRITEQTATHLVLSNAWSTNIIVPLDVIVRREGPATVTPPGTNVVTIPALASPPPPPPPDPLIWNGEVQLGTDLGFSEKNRQLYTGRAKMTLGYHRVRNVFDYSFSYGRTEGIVSANRMDGTAKTDYDFTSRWYVYNLIGAGYDEIRKINLRMEAGPGLGYHAVKRTNFLFKTEAGINYQAQYLADDTKSELVFFRFAEEAMWKINSRLTFDERFEFFPEVGNFARYRFRFETNLRYALMNNLFFTLTVLDQYDTNPAEGVGPNDLQVRSTIGVKF